MLMLIFANSSPGQPEVTGWPWGPEVTEPMSPGTLPSSLDTQEDHGFLWGMLALWYRVCFGVQEGSPKHPEAGPKVRGN